MFCKSILSMLLINRHEIKLLFTVKIIVTFLIVMLSVKLLELSYIRNQTKNMSDSS